MQPSAQGKEVNTVQSFTSCGGKRQWCLRQMAKRREGFVVQSLAELDCRILVERPPCLTKPNAFTTKVKVGPCRRMPQGSVLQGSIGTMENVDTRRCGNGAKEDNSTYPGNLKVL